MLNNSIHQSFNDALPSLHEGGVLLEDNQENGWDYVNIPFTSYTPDQQKNEIELITTPDPQQRRALELMNEGKNVFLSGGSATGKTAVLNLFRANNPNKKMLFLAPNAQSALNINGINIYEFLDCKGSWRNLHGHLTASKEDVIMEADCIVIDDVSMVSPYYLDDLSNSISACREIYDEFAGLQVIVAGNFYDTPPLDPNVCISNYYDECYEEQYAFYSCAWRCTKFETVELTNNYRQVDQLFNSFLNNLPTLGGNANELVQQLNDHETRCRAENRPADPFAIDLCISDKDADIITNDNYQRLSGDIFHYPAYTWGSTYEDYNLAPVLSLRLGLKVMFVADNPPYYTQGTIGYIVKLDSNEIHVQLKDGTVINVGRHYWQYPDGAIAQYPLVCGYAIRVNVSKGLMLDSANIILGDGPFSEELLYSAISRVKSLDGIRLSKLIDINKITSNSPVREFYDGKVNYRE